jgi:broad specificity phosphatase PhoE
MFVTKNDAYNVSLKVDRIYILRSHPHVNKQIWGFCFKMAALVEDALASSGNQRQTVFVLRHGDRYDFSVGKEKWSEAAKRLHDPPLSTDVGSAQIQDLFAYFRSLRASEPELNLKKVLTSPFLRCISTANPIAGAWDASLLIEDSLWEIAYQNETMATALERACYYPCIDVNYKSCFRPKTDEEFPVGCMERFGRAAEAIEQRFLQGPDAETSLVICTHAAGVVTVVSALLRVSMDSFQPASPAALYRLERDSPQEPWRLCPDVSVNSYDELTRRSGSSEAHLHRAREALLRSGGVSKTGPWPVRFKDMSEEEIRQSSYGLSYPTWADLWLEAGERASWLSSGL